MNGLRATPSGKQFLKCFSFSLKWDLNLNNSCNGTDIVQVNIEHYSCFLKQANILLEESQLIATKEENKNERQFTFESLLSGIFMDSLNIFVNLLIRELRHCLRRPS